VNYWALFWFITRLYSVTSQEPSEDGHSERESWRERERERERERKRERIFINWICCEMYLWLNRMLGCCTWKNHGRSSVTDTYSHIVSAFLRFCVISIFGLRGGTIV